MRAVLAAGFVAAVCVVAVAACGGGGSSGGGGGSGDAVSASEVSTYAGIQVETAQIYQEMLEGINKVSKTAGSSESKPVVDEYNPQKQLALFSPIFSTGCNGCVGTILPIDPANAKPLVTEATRANAYLSLTYLNIPGYNPWEAGNNFVSFLSFDGKENGYENGKALLETMGGKGNVIEIDGTPGPGPGGGSERGAGFKKALEEFPEVKLLSDQHGEWEQEKGREITETLLSKYGSEIEGIWCANDAEAIGVVQALKAAGLEGKIPVTGMNGAKEALELVKSGALVSTSYESGVLIGAVGTALAHAAAVGDINPEELSHAERKFNIESTLVTKENVDEFLGESNPEFSPSEITYQALKKNFTKFSAGPISPSE